MNGYKAFYNGRETDIHADTLLQAKEKAVAFFKPPKSKTHMVHVHLCEKDGEQVTHVAVD
ncbi:hypothetical protein [Microvirga tunisiensis]|uniref:Uncharacterized protein n=1 Tax=Microvirga tunisiensis TaxID=2108360 RepID=A0A5N7MSB8_9HYPH|nr:hypothetical protein [Microvirga tunisiensis]MPR11943.1 hypothetical protein [Microvirga tunisiensis]MPR29901.1 hypothetical protein [Microvirga tunisiensis]